MANMKLEKALVAILEETMQDPDKDRVTRHLLGIINGILGVNFAIHVGTPEGDKLDAITHKYLLNVAQISPKWKQMIERN